MYRSNKYNTTQGNWCQWGGSSVARLIHGVLRYIGLSIPQHMKAQINLGVCGSDTPELLGPESGLSEPACHLDLSEHLPVGTHLGVYLLIWS